jgi:hypothetical protein
MVRSAWDGQAGAHEGEVPAQDIPDGLPRVGLVLVPVLDEAALAALVARVRAAIAQATRDGFNDALGEQFGQTAGDGGVPAQARDVPAARFDPNPTVNSADPYAYQKYAERLDREVPGWWYDEVSAWMAPGLFSEANKRRLRDRAELPASLRTGG